MRWMVVLLVVIVAILLIIIGVGVIYSPVTSDTQDVQQETFGDDELIEQSIPECLELGCDTNTQYVGSINSDKYYTCSCHHADRINAENIACFSDDEDATEQGYEKVEDC